LSVDVSPESAVLEDPYKVEVREHYDRVAARRDAFHRRNSYYHQYLLSALGRLVPQGRSVLELGCGTGDLLAGLNPAVGVGVDISPAMIAIARAKYPGIEFETADAETFKTSAPLDFVIASDLIGELSDISALLERVQEMSTERTKLILTFHNPAHEGTLRMAQRLGLALPPARQSWVGVQTVVNLLELSDFELERWEHGFLMPRQVPILSGFVNRHLAGRRATRYLDITQIVVAFPSRPRPRPRSLSCSVVIPCRNELDNVEPAVERTPEMGSHTELIFVDGSSTDGTKERIEEMIERYRGQKDIKLLLQVPEADYSVRDDPDTPTVMLKLGKGDAVRKAFDAAQGEVLMILDADLTVPPEDLPRFFDAIAKDKGSFINGSRLVYPMEERAMPFFNYLGNWFFGRLFSWLLEQPVQDTLCGTKVLHKDDYQRIKAGRAHFGEFDPFGDFDLLFGAARLGLRIREVPVRYRRRVAGVSKVRVARHGWLLIGMSAIAFRRLKLAKWVGRRAGARVPAG
jgi:glycosyltransferase involved in cell wall biosynthesis